VSDPTGSRAARASSSRERKELERLKKLKARIDKVFRIHKEIGAINEQDMKLLKLTCQGASDRQIREVTGLSRGKLKERRELLLSQLEGLI